MDDPEFVIAVRDLRKPRCRQAFRETVRATDKRHARMILMSRDKEQPYRVSQKVKRVLKRTSGDSQ